MQRLFYRIWGAIKKSKVFRCGALAIFPFFARPLHFEDGKPRSKFLRLLKSPWITPTIPAVIAQWAIVQVTEIVLFTKINPHDISLLEMSEKVSCFSKIAGWMTFSLWIVVTYLISIVSWLFYNALSCFYKKLGKNAKKIPLQFFVIKTAAVSLWLAVSLKVFGMFYEDSHGDIASMSKNIAIAFSSHDTAVVVTFLVVGLLQHAAARNNNLGLLEIYSGDRKLMIATNICVFASLFLLLIITTKFL